MPENEIKKPSKSIGALWQKIARGRGTRYYGGRITIDGQYYPIVVFPNTKKSKPEQPDFSILISEPLPHEAPYQYATDREPEEVD